MAEREFLLDNSTESVFPIRRKPDWPNFYQQLENELTDQTVVAVNGYRTVKEKWVRVSRPSRMRITNESLLRERPHLRALASEIGRWRNEFTDLPIDELLRTTFKDALADPALTRSCLEVLTYLLSHRTEVEGLLPRQVQHSSSTKLICIEPLLLRVFSLWRREPAGWGEFLRFFGLADKPVEFRFFTTSCRCQGHVLMSFHGIVSTETIREYDFSSLSETLIVENLQTFHAEVAAGQNDRMIIWGGGWKAAVLRRMHERLPRPIRYWGDIDKEGYEIFGHLKSAIPDLQPINMDQQTMLNHLRFAIHRDKFFGPFRDVHELQGIYQEVCQQGLCIEQEKIRWPSI
jgi:hypothetical protein